MEGAVPELLAARSRGLCWSAMLELGLRVGRGEGTGSVSSSPPQFFDSQHRGERAELLGVRRGKDESMRRDGGRGTGYTLEGSSPNSL